MDGHRQSSQLIPLRGSSSAVQPSREDDQTWLEFLRSAGGTVSRHAPPPNSRHNSASSTNSLERKRRHTSTDMADSRRRHPYEAQSTNSGQHLMGQPHVDSTGTGFSNLDSLSRGENVGVVRSRMSRSGGQDLLVGLSPDARHTARVAETSHRPGISAHARGENNEVPRWQPDDETTGCTVCGTAFGMFNRRHHCRKCGRVVCGPCSPHRITIPRPFIVRPPSMIEDGNIEGGEEVRVCKPCVPDPWVPPPPPPDSTRPTAARPSTQSEQSHFGELRGSESGLQSRTAVPRPSNMQSPHQINSPHATARYRSQSHTAFGYRFPPDASLVGSAPIRNNGLGQQIHRHRLSQGAAAPFMPSLAGVPPQRNSQPYAPSDINITQIRPRRPQLREEDECPVCHNQLPSGEAQREAHIMDCINNATLGPDTPPRAPSAPPTAADGATIESVASGSTPPRLSDHARSRAALSHRPSGMLVFTATEKDCVDSDGRAQECQICLEDYEVGDEMGRLECWCKFHRICIRQWWEQKGPGSCPTHQLQQ